jgi:uncharacterized iron-regulated membrane protein
MTRAQWYRVHRWIAVTAGVFLLSQIISGIVMELPLAPVQRRNVRPDYASASISPAQAVAAAGGAAADPVLARLAGRLVYQVGMGQGMRMVDAHSGAILPVTSALAEEIVRTEYAPAGARLETARVDRHEKSYRGTLPAYRVEAAGIGVRYYVSTRDGGVFEDTDMRRVRAFIGSVHTLHVVPFIGDHPKARKLALGGAGVLALGAVGSGYWIAWIRRRKERAESHA